MVGDQRRSTASWVDVADRFVSIQVHEPPGQACGVLVVIPPVGRESVVTFRTLRTLAVRAARAGWLVVRMEQSGVGESQVPLGDDLVAQWDDDVAAVVAKAGSWAPGAPITVLGLRLGANLAVRSDRRAVETVLAWEPVAPKMWLREQRTLRVVSLSVPRSSSEGVHEYVGMTLTDAQRASLAALTPPAPDEPHDVSLLLEEDRQAAKGMYAAEVAVAKAPAGAIDRVLEALPRREPSWQIRFDPQRVVTRQVGGREVCMAHEEWGPHAFPAVVTGPADGTSHVTVVMAPGSSEAKYGPSGLWAELAPELASLGATVVRADRRGAGELSDPAVEVEPPPYGRLVPRDTAEILGEARRRWDQPIIGVGVCSGGWALAAASDEVPVERVVAFNTVCWFTFAPWLLAQLRWREAQERLLGEFDVTPRRRARDLVIVSGAKATVYGWGVVAYLADKARPHWREWLVRWSPKRYLTRLVGQQSCTPIDVYLGRDDEAMTQELFGPEVFADGLAEGCDGPLAHRDEALDHGLLSREGRSRARLLVRRLVESC